MEERIVYSHKQRGPRNQNKKRSVLDVKRGQDTVRSSFSFRHLGTFPNQRIQLVQTTRANRPDQSKAKERRVGFLCQPKIKK